MSKLSELSHKESFTLKDKWSDFLIVRDLQDQNAADSERTDLKRLNTPSEFTELNTQVTLMKLNLVSEKEWTKQAQFQSQAWRHSNSKLILSVMKRAHYKKWVKEDELYCTKNYVHFQQFTYSIELISEEGCLTEVNCYLNYKVAKWWDIHKAEKSTENNWENLKEFLKSLFENYENQVHNAWMNWINCHKLNSETDDEYLYRSEELQTQIDDDTKNLHHIQLMLFFKDMNVAMRQKIHKYSVFLKLWEDLIILAKKLCLSVNDEVSIRTVSSDFTVNYNVSSFFKWREWNPITSSFIKVTEYNTLQEKFEGDCHYCKQHDHREWDCLKKKSDLFSEKSHYTDSAISSNQIVNLTVTYEPLRVIIKINKSKDTLPTSEQRLWLAVHLAERSVITVLDSVSDLNLICKNIAELLTSVFKAVPLQHAEGQLLWTYSVYHKEVEVKDSFRNWRQTHKPFTSADLEMSLILRLSWLQQDNSKIDFINLQVQWRTAVKDIQSSSSEKTIWDSLAKKLEDLKMNYIIQKLQVIELKDQKSSGTSISEVYCKLTKVFSEVQTETLSLHHEENHTIELLERTTLSFELMYNLFTKELKVLQQYLNVNLKNRFIQPS